MAVVATEGFDMYNGDGANIGTQARWVRSGGDPSCGLAAGRFGGQCLAISGSNVQYSMNWPGGYLSFGYGTALLATISHRYPTVVRIQDISSNTVVSLTVDFTTATITATGPGGTIGSVSGLTLGINTWHYLEIYGTVNSSTGTCQVYLNGAQILNLSGVNTGSTSAQRVQYNSDLGGSNNNLQLDDIFVSDASARLGECRVETLRATGDSTVTWTPNSGGNNYSRVNETLVDGDTSFVSTAVVGNRDLYTIGPLSSTPASIYAINLVGFDEKTDANTRTVFHSLRSVVTDSDGSPFSLAASYQRYDRVLVTDPATSAAWTASGVNNLLIGPKLAS